RSHRKVVTIGKDGSPAWEPGGRTLWGAPCGSLLEVSLGAQRHFRRVTPLRPDPIHVDPDVSPDGHAIAFSRSGRMRRWNLEPSTPGRRCLQATDCGSRQAPGQRLLPDPA